MDHFLEKLFNNSESLAKNTGIGLFGALLTIGGLVISTIATTGLSKTAREIGNSTPPADLQ